MKRDCQSLEPLLHAYLEDWLAEAERGVVQAHLHRCLVCQAKLRSWESVRDALRALPRLTAPTSVPRALAGEPTPHFALRLAFALCLPTALFVAAYSHSWQLPTLENFALYESVSRLTERAHEGFTALWGWLQQVL